jgi:hypothetical protein
MKKIFTILFVVALTTTTSYAQAQWGATLGLNFASISGDDAPDSGDQSKRLGIRLGVTADIPLSDAMSLNTGALYSVKGMASDDDPMDNNISVNYLEIPLSVGFSVSDQFSLLAGPYVGIVMGSSITTGGEEITDYETSDLVASFDLGLNLGASVFFTDAFSMHTGYQMGLTSLDPDGDSKSYNSNILVGVTYSFGG